MHGDWPKIYYALSTRRISPAGILRHVYDSKQNFPIPESSLIQLEVYQDDPGRVMEIIKVGLQIGDDTLLLARGKHDWEVAILKEIVTSDLNVEAKLDRINVAWADLGYPESWRPFISYLPTTEVEGEKSREAVLNRCVRFLADRDE
jgi:hypothetical protein